MKKLFLSLILFISFAAVAQDRVGNGANVMNEYASCEGDNFTFRIRGKAVDFNWEGALAGPLMTSFNCQQQGDDEGNIARTKTTLFYCAEKTKEIEKLIVRIEVNRATHRLSAKLRRIQVFPKKAIDLAQMDCMTYE